MSSPTQRSLKYLRDQGYTAEVVEKRVPHTNTTRDLFGVVDIIAIKGAETLAVQTTTAPNVAARVKKIADCEHIGAIREAGWTFHVHGWSRKANGRYELRTVDVS